MPWPLIYAAGAVVVIAAAWFPAVWLYRFIPPLWRMFKFKLRGR